MSKITDIFGGSGTNTPQPPKTQKETQDEKGGTFWDNAAEITNNISEIYATSKGVNAPPPPPPPPNYTPVIVVGVVLLIVVGLIYFKK